VIALGCAVPQVDAFTCLLIVIALLTERGGKQAAGRECSR
jgi:hypothetical protein